MDNDKILFIEKMDNQLYIGLSGDGGSMSYQITKEDWWNMDSFKLEIQPFFSRHFLDSSIVINKEVRSVQFLYQLLEPRVQYAANIVKNDRQFHIRILEQISSFTTVLKTNGDTLSDLGFHLQCMMEDQKLIYG